MSLNDLSDLNTAGNFQRLITSTSAILKAKVEEENQQLENSFISLADRARLLFDSQLDTVTAELHRQFRTFIQQAGLVLTSK